jgi:hypothetical protein
MSAPIAPLSAAERGPRAWWLRLAPRRRRTLKVLCAVAGVLVLLVSIELARFLQLDNVERDDELALIEAEAKGDAPAMISRLSGCSSSPACVASVRTNAGDERLRRRGAVKILSLDSPTANSPSAKTGTTRLAWTVIGALPVVQCVKVRRTGNVLAGMHVELIALSAPIANEGICHKRTENEIEEEEATAVEEGR